MRRINAETCSSNSYVIICNKTINIVQSLVELNTLIPRSILYSGVSNLRPDKFCYAGLSHISESHLHHRKYTKSAAC